MHLPQAVGSLASGTGPLLFAAIFSQASKGGPSAPGFCPEVVWYLAAALGVVAAVLTACLYVGDKHGKDTAMTDLSPGAPLQHGSAGAAGEGRGADEEAGQGDSPFAASSGGASPRGSRGNGKGAGPDPHDPWVMARTVDLRSSLDRLRSFHAAAPGGHRRSQQSERAGVVSPLLPENDGKSPRP